MNLKDWKRFIIPPIAIYAVIFLFISALIGAKINQNAIWVWIVSLIITIVGLYISVNYVKPKNSQEGLRLGFVWVIILVILDLILTIPFTGIKYFYDWRSYIPYILTILIPTVLSNKSRQDSN